MSTQRKSKQPEADISALPSPDPAQMAAEIADLGLECETLKSSLKLANEARDNAQRQAELLQTALTEAKRDNALIMAELGDVARQRDAATVAAENAQTALDEWEAHPFFGVIHQLNKQCGEISAELVEHTDKVIAGANDTGKAGKVTLTIAIKPSEEHAKAMIAAAKVTSTMPKADPAKAVFFMQAGKITADDPQQPKLPLTGAQGRRPAPTEADRELERRLAAAKPAVVVPDECPAVPQGYTDDYDRVLELVNEGVALTVSQIQRRLGVGYTRALALFDLNNKRVAWQAASPA